MKTVFEKKDVNFGCYDSRNKYRINTPKAFNIDYVLGLPIPLKDKFWFVRNNCGLTDGQLRELAIGVATIVLPIYETTSPNNKAPREAIRAAQDYLNGAISLEELKRKRAAAYVAYATTAAYTATAYAAARAAYATTAAADAAYAAAADVADVADASNVSHQLHDFLKQFIHQQ